ncbi:enoyl-CoA hydratase [Lacimicrobium alkaliphilum]|uniref:Enoyl-CoA hydratase n=1 Tax=Lacimicrobium alkaliphilum TaxID=1526571 RepID=A0ABQ1RGB4_9ALTE|nr:enoyl-CoA hydratase [Lacimicrobium alkaliphilum]GGD68881.1 enoyl-CoA hydratase [Lacimicrobium alkaliphilum]
MTEILIQQKNQVLEIIFNRADKKNALTHVMYEKMAVALEQASSSSEIRAVLFKGEGKDFTAGNDLNDFANASGPEQVEQTVRFMTALMKCPLPVVAQVQGMAVGIGTTLLLHCDLVYCADNTRFSMPFIDLALVPEYASSYLLPRLVGHRKAAQWLMAGEPFDAAEAEQVGLINQALPPEELEQKVDNVLRNLVGKPKQAMKLTKLLMKTSHQEVTRHMHNELDLFIKQLKSDAAKEAFAAFLEKRKPDPSRYN